MEAVVRVWIARRIEIKRQTAKLDHIFGLAKHVKYMDSKSAQRELARLGWNVEKIINHEIGEYRTTLRICGNAVWDSHFQLVWG